MDIVSLLFYRSWLDAVRGEAPPSADNRVSGEGQIYCAGDGGGPDWRRVLVPLAAIAVLVLAGAAFPAST